MRPEDRAKAAAYLHTLQHGWVAHPSHHPGNMTADAAAVALFAMSEHVFAGVDLSEATKLEVLKQLLDRMGVAFDARPTEIDDPVVRIVLDEIISDIERTEEAAGRNLPPRPFFGTLPSGELNSVTIAVPDTDVYIVALQSGTIGFVDVAFRAVLAALPSPRRSVLNTVGASLDDVRAALSADPTPALNFTSFITSYVFQGTPYSDPHAPLAGLKAYMHTWTRHIAEAFIVGHEYGHLAAGHLAHGQRDHRLFGPQRAEVRTQAWTHEFEADSFGLGLALSMSRHVLRLPTVLGYAAVDMLFSLIDLVERCVSITQADERRPRSTHPPATQRQALLRAQLASVLPDPAVSAQALDAAIGLSRVIELLGELAQDSVRILVRAGFRPAPIWTR